MSTAISVTEILQQTTVYLSEVLSQSDLRHRLFTIFLEKIPSSDHQIPLKPLKLASETLENALSTSNPSIKSSSLRLAEKLLQSYPKNRFSSFLLSLIYALFRRPNDAAINLFDIFHLDPSLARVEIAPHLFEELFLRHFLPVLEWYNEQRSRILSTSSSVNLGSGYDSDEQSVVVSPSRLLKNMSDNQALGFKDLERDYEEILDENCRAFAKYFREVLQNKDGKHLVDPPPVLLQIGEGEKSGNQEPMQMQRKFSLKNGRYNVILFFLVFFSYICPFIDVLTLFPLFHISFLTNSNSHISSVIITLMNSFSLYRNYLLFSAFLPQKFFPVFHVTFYTI